MKQAFLVKIPLQDIVLKFKTAFHLELLKGVLEMDRKECFFPSEEEKNETKQKITKL